MKKYLYLTKKEWVIPWVNGGRVPISLASRYLSNARKATLTPDETLIHESPIDVRELANFGFIFNEVRSFSVVNCMHGDKVIPDINNGSFYTDDGLILSFCNVKSNKVCARLEKLACVEISDILELKNQIDSQLGVSGQHGNCSYTTDHRRNHFLKSVSDSWQQEYRIFWPLKEERHVTIHRGMARSIKI